jgi:hypothetical protein
MGSDLTGHLALDMGPELTASIVHSSGIKNIGRLVAQMGGGITGALSSNRGQLADLSFLSFHTDRFQLAILFAP